MILILLLPIKVVLAIGIFDLLADKKVFRNTFYNILNYSMAILSVHCILDEELEKNKCGNLSYNLKSTIKITKILSNNEKMRLLYLDKIFSSNKRRIFLYLGNNKINNINRKLLIKILLQNR